MERSPFLPLPEGMVIGQIQVTQAQLTVEVTSTQPSAACPGCGCSSQQIHSHYQRTVHDAPCVGRRVVLRLTVRKFFCRVPSCQRKVFAERLPDLVEPWARVSNRLLSEVKAIGLSASAEVSERLAPQLGMKVKAPTLLRYLRMIPDPADTSVQVLGIDDFAMRRGESYGTLLINMQTHRPLDLLPDRTSEAVFPWLRSHPEIEIVSRDRASAYADAVKRALAHATQVADRYHLIQNLREHLQHFFDHKRSYLPKISDISLKGVKAGFSGDRSCAEPLLACSESREQEAVCLTSSPQAPEQRAEQDQGEDDLSCLTFEDRRKKISRDKRYAHYEQVMALHRAGMGLRAISRHLGISRNVVRRFVASPSFPERASRSGPQTSPKSKLTAYLPYLRERWEAGTYNSSQLFREIKERGFTGSPSLVRRMLSEWRSELPAQSRQGQPRKPRLTSTSPERRLSSRSASFLMILSPEKLTTVKQQQVEQICQASSELHAVYLLSQSFVTMLKERRAEELDAWLKRARESHVHELTTFANGISQDHAAVRAACSLPWSNGTTEGHVNRLKFLKRQMFGRAHLDLLRVKVLHAV